MPTSGRVNAAFYPGLFSFATMAEEEGQAMLQILPPRSPTSPSPGPSPPREGDKEDPLHSFRKLSRACLSGEPSDRPTFSQILASLRGIMADIGMEPLPARPPPEPRPPQAVSPFMDPGIVLSEDPGPSV